MAFAPWPSPIGFDVRFDVQPDSDATLSHAVPHIVVSQVLRPAVATFMPPQATRIRTLYDAQCCITTVDLRSVMPAIFKYASRPSDCEWLVLADGFSDILALTQLRQLTLSHCTGLDSAFFAALPTLTQLRFLSIVGCQSVEPESLKNIGGLQSLEELCVRESDAVTAAFVAHIARERPTLRCLHLTQCSGVDAAVVASVSQMTLLEELDLSSSSRDGIDASALTHLRDLRHLRSLSLRMWRIVDPEGLAHLTKLTSLKALDLFGVSGVDATGLKHVSKLHQLETLDLTGCDGVDENGLAHISALSELRTLSVERCRSLDVACFKHIARLPRLAVLCVGGPGIDVTEPLRLTGLTQRGSKLELRITPPIEVVD